LEEDPSTSFTTLAAEAGVSRNLVHRRFPDREALRDAVFRAKLDAVDAVLREARLEYAPVEVALHRFVEGVIAVIRRYPINPEQMRSDAQSYTRMLDQRERVAAFMQRAMDEGLIRTDLPDGVAPALLHKIIALVTFQLPDHDPARAADVAVDTLLRGIGQN